jgi:endonuclease-3
MIQEQAIDRERGRLDKILAFLKKRYPSIKITLRFSNPFELVVATILSAQCQDERVNKVTASLFKKYRSLKDYADADLETFQEDIRSTGFYRNKAKNIKAAARQIIERFDSRLPRAMGELLELPGVARKTANVVLFNAFGKNEGIAVDTHVKRLSGRLGLTQETDPVKIERDLMSMLDQREWGGLSLRLIRYGREVCKARRPDCRGCCLNNLCPSAALKKQGAGLSRPA